VLVGVPSLISQLFVGCYPHILHQTMDIVEFWKSIAVEWVSRTREWMATTGATISTTNPGVRLHCV